jgi:hypothetical protein
MPCCHWRAPIEAHHGKAHTPAPPAVKKNFVEPSRRAATLRRGTKTLVEPPVDPRGPIMDVDPSPSPSPRPPPPLLGYFDPESSGRREEYRRYR